MAMDSGYFEDLVKSNKLDASKRELVTLKGISKCKEITWLDVSSNKLDSLQWLKKLKQIIVLKASNNKLTSIHHILHLKNLKALILNNNCLQSVDGIEMLSSLSSLVLSHNNLQTIDVSQCRHLTKLSLSHNSFQEFPSIVNLSDLKELRLNDNQIEDVPATVSSCKQLKLIDLGNNKIASFGFLEALRASNVQNLNLKGNKIFSLPEYRDKILGSLHHVKVLDGRRIADEEKGKILILPDMPEKETSTQKQDATKSTPTSTMEKSKKCHNDSKPPKVGGFVSRFINDTEKTEMINEAGTGLEAGLRRSSDGNTKAPGNTRESAKKVSGRKKRKLKEIKNCEDEGLEETKLESKSVSTDPPSKSNQEMEGASAVKNETRGEGEHGAGKEKEMSVIIRKRKRSMGKKDIDDVKKSNRMSKDSKKKEGGDVRVVDVLSNSMLVQKSDETVGVSSTKLAGNGGKQITKSKVENCATIARESSKRVKTLAKRSKADKRSGVLGVKVIKRKQQRSVPIDLEVFDKAQGHEFGVGKGGGW